MIVKGGSMRTLKRKWATTFWVRKTDPTLAQIVQGVRRKMPELKRVGTVRLLSRISVIERRAGGKALLIGYNSSPPR